MGAAPQVLYNLLIQAVADAGYTVIATPYELTFRHADCARAVREEFQQSIAALRREGKEYLVPEGVPQCGLGHSNGALLHLLIGSLYDQPVTSNIVVSFNNKYAAAARVDE